ncbi:hypothetical protein RRG08_015362 [Elysia crispata]|uniref:Uncharacterized protein n=1 Tax=Elysia crispata TaxID=231223 RepID=A0AAE1A8L7_9GAST|nr:hypothetical protein RRG08_015362 [Elysia crispata]
MIKDSISLSSRGDGTGSVRTSSRSFYQWLRRYGAELRGEALTTAQSTQHVLRMTDSQLPRTEQTAGQL